MRRNLLVGLLVVLGLGCGFGRENAPVLPAGVTCARVLTPGDGANELTEALAAVGPGECVVPRGTEYKGAFNVPAGAKLLASEGAVLSIAGSSSTQAAVTLAGGEGSGLYGIRVPSSAGVGLQVMNGPATVSKVVVQGAAKAALLIACSGDACLQEQNAVQVISPDLRTSGIGLWAYRAWVKVSGGAVAGNKSLSLATGYGVVASAGALLQVEGTRIEGNQEVGVLVDGLEGTSAELDNAKVVNNQGRGVWAQGLLGSAEAPKLTIRGPDTSIDGNSIVGVGARDSKGIRISEARITRTVKVNLPTSPGSMEAVGDGLGLFEGSSEVRVERVIAEDNQRSQMLVDQGGVGIIIVDIDRVAGGEYKIVVQRTTNQVSAPTPFVSGAARELAVSAKAFPVGAP